VKKKLLLSLFSLAILIFTAEADNDIYADGVYEGEYSFIKVRVTIKDGDMCDIDILHHGGGGKKYADMVAPLADEVVRKQSLDVDVITGATVSSRNFKKAVENALEKAIPEI